MAGGSEFDVAVPLLDPAGEAVDHVDHGQRGLTSQRRSGRACWEALRNPWHAPLPCIIAATLLYSTADALSKLLGRSIPFLQVILLRSLLHMPALLTLAWSSGDRPLLGHPSLRPTLLLRGSLASLTLITIYASLMLIPIGDAMAIFYASNAAVAIAAVALRLDLNLRWFTWPGVASNLIGAVLIARPPSIFGGETHWTFDRRLGLALAFLAMLLLSCCMLLIRHLGAHNSPIQIAIWYPMASIPIAGAPLLFGFPQPASWPLSPMQWLGVVIYSAMVLAAEVLNVRGIQLSSATLASTINAAELIFGRLTDVVMFGDRVRALGGVGTGLMFAGAVAGEGWEKTRRQDLAGIAQNPRSRTRACSGARRHSGIENAQTLKRSSTQT
eukprot:evm.model.scf_2535.1 EVM.evm.TU.scf_2535.1   scf_2535:15620-17935(+)